MATQNLTGYGPSHMSRIAQFNGDEPNLPKENDEDVTDYIIRAETTASALREAKEKIGDSLLIAMILKGLPEAYRSFTTGITQKKDNVFSRFQSCPQEL
ncbi:CCHC-type zinc finger, nucleic acid binding protein a [Elysia marginata]|uniref:CCHC-type zinc finger, nucleic acid binding protein a n=1 Tax=Elysia marginata TaxID=1093978 RepID=A0AAV4F5I4_9GAST|nr:CCHC-type zinc finger, nucleic acid binding protein a [Elysia marginata]